MIASAYFLTDVSHKAVPVKMTKTGVTLRLPDRLPDDNASVLVLDINGAPGLLTSREKSEK